MLTFMQYLDEVKRDDKRAHKLLDYLSKRHGNKHDEVHTGRDFEDMNHMNVADAGAYNHVFKPTLKRSVTIGMHKLKPLQKFVQVDGVRNKLKGVGPGTQGPITVVKHDGQHYVADGHHRWFAARLRGDEDIEANIINTPLTDKQKRRKKLYGSIDRRFKD